jgi:hypothetical protein
LPRKHLLPGEAHERKIVGRAPKRMAAKSTVNGVMVVLDRSRGSMI